MTETRCPCCGALCQVVGDTTLHYEPVDQEHLLRRLDRAEREAKVAATATLLEAVRAHLDAIDHYTTETVVTGSDTRARAYVRMEQARRRLADLAGWERKSGD